MIIRRAVGVRPRLAAALAAANVGLVLSGCGGGSALPTTPNPSPPPPTTVPRGVDYGLKRQCARTLSPDQPNFYVDNIDCPGPPYPTSRYWLTVAEIETAGIGGSCIGAPNQSVLINGPGSPITENWQGNSTTGYTVELKTDYANMANVCVAPTYSALAFIDHAQNGGGPLPRPDQFQLQFTANFNRTLAAGAGGVHAGMATDVFWMVAGSPNPIHVSMQIDFFYDPSVSCCPLPPGMPPDVLAYGAPTPGYPVYTIDLDATKLNPAIVVPMGVTTPITVNWGTILNHVIAENLVPPPVNGWANSNAFTTACQVGLEIKNNLSGPGGPMADFFVSNYRESAIISNGGNIQTRAHRRI